MRPLRICALALAAVVLCGCSTTATARPDLPTTPAAPSTAVGADSSTLEPTPDERPLQALLPSDFRGVEAHTFPIGQDMLDRLAAAIGLSRRALEAAYASDHGPAFVQMYALRARGHDPHELLDALPQAAYPAAGGTIKIEERRLGDRPVTVISEPSQAATIGSFYTFVDGGTLIVAQALAEPVAEAAFDELPPAG